MTAPLPAGTRVTLTGTALGYRAAESGREHVRIDGDYLSMFVTRDALTVVVPPEPEWQVGDAVRIDGDTIVREVHCSGVHWWWNARQGRVADRWSISRAWSEGRVRVLYCQNQERDDA